MFDPPPPPTHRCDVCSELALYAPGTCWDCRDARKLEAEQRRKVDDQLRVIPPRYRDAGEHLAERVADKRAIDATRDALAHHIVVVLVGPPGAGKSSLAGAMLAAQAEAGKTIAWAPALRLAHARAESKYGEEPEEIRRAIRAHVAVIDDLAQEPITTISAVVDVIHARHDANRPLIVTSGTSRRDLGTRYGGGTGRRLLEHALVVEVAARGAR